MNEAEVMMIGQREKGISRRNEMAAGSVGFLMGAALATVVTLGLSSHSNTKYASSIEAQRNSESVLVEEGKDSSFGEAGGQLPMSDWEQESLEWREMRLKKRAESERKFNKSMKRYDETMARLNLGYEKMFARFERLNLTQDGMNRNLAETHGSLQSVGDDIERFVDKYIEIPGGTDEN